MPQLNKQGKFVYGISIIKKDLSVQLPDQILREYSIAQSGKIIVLTGSKSTGGFCITSKEILEKSKLSHILNDLTKLRDYQLASGEFIQYKGRSYSWIPITESGLIQLPIEMMKFLGLSAGNELLSIRSSNIAITMGAFGPLLEKARRYQGEIP